MTQAEGNTVPARLTTSDLERSWREGADDAVVAYVEGGAGANRTVEGNVSAFAGLWLRPRGLYATEAKVDTTVTLLGTEVTAPIVLAPTSPQRLLHPDAELATARAARRTGVMSIVSTDSHYAFPEIAAEAPGLSWFQLYGYRSRADIEATLELARIGGATAIVVTVDAAHAARRISAERAGFRLPSNVDYGTLRRLGILNGAGPASGRLERLPLTWEDLRWIRALTTLPLLVKGILRAEDARRCVELGADGIIVSNHGGRQLDGVVPSVIALCDIVPAVPDGTVLLVDGGVRSGVDVAKALALGAHAVCVGRPYLWGLGVGGQAGVENVIEMLRLELEDAMAQLAVSSIGELGREFLTTAAGPVPGAGQSL
jgi:4-hydroxymandelate oxidase